MTVFSKWRDWAWWILPIALLVAILGWETDFGRALHRRAPPDAPIVPKPVVAALLPEYAIPGGVASRTETVNRSLFNPTRRPAPSLAVDASKQRMQRGLFALTGTLIVEGKNTAFLREVKGGKPRRAREGETIDGLTVAEVKVDRVKLTLGDESEELILRVAAGPKTTTQPALPVPLSVTAAAGAASGMGTAPIAAGATTGDQLTEQRRRAARAAEAARGQAPSPAGAGLGGGAVAGGARPPGGGGGPGPRKSAEVVDPRWEENATNIMRERAKAPQ